MELLDQLIRIDVTSEACHDVDELVFEVSVIEVNWEKEWNAVSKEEMQGG